MTAQVALFDLREENLLEFDSDDWRALPLEVQGAINNAAIACDGLAPLIMEAVDP